jgi:hypothetical protein
MGVNWKEVTLSPVAMVQLRGSTNGALASNGLCWFIRCHIKWPPSSPLEMPSYSMPGRCLSSFIYGLFLY